MFCKYCGQQIDDDAAFCSKCGKAVAAEAAPAAAPKKNAQRKLHLQRKKQFYGCGVTLSILIDGKEAAKLSNGGEATVNISTESHSLNIHQNNLGGKFKSKTFVINAGEGDVHGYITPPLFGDKWTITFEYM